jgi:hypothetical protein
MKTYEVTTTTGSSEIIEAATEASALKKAHKKITGEKPKKVLWHGKRVSVNGLEIYHAPRWIG